jgi:methylamine dehydrogenase accessory protein MauD
LEGLWFVSYIALWTLVLLEGIIIVVLLRQIGLLHLRLQPAGARATNVGPDIGTKLPERRADGLAGNPVAIVDHRRPKLLLFVSPHCSACDELMPAVKTIARSERDTLDVILITANDDEASNRSYIKKHGLADIPYVASADVAWEYGVMTTPHALVVDSDGVVRSKGIVNHIEHLESLVEALSTGHATIQSYLATKSGRDDHAR